MTPEIQKSVKALILAHLQQLAKELKEYDDGPSVVFTEQVKIDYVTSYLGRLYKEPSERIVAVFTEYLNQFIEEQEDK